MSLPCHVVRWPLAPVIAWASGGVRRCPTGTRATLRSRAPSRLTVPLGASTGHVATINRAPTETTFPAVAPASIHSPQVSGPQ